MNKKTLMIFSIIVAIIITITCIIVFILKNIDNKEIFVEDKNIHTSEDSIDIEENSIIVQNNIENIVATNIETKDKTEEVSDTKEEVKEILTQDKNSQVKETKENKKQDTKDKELVKTEQKENNTKEETKQESVVNKSENTQVQETTPKKEDIITEDKEETKEEVIKEETKKIDLSKYDYYEESLNGTYKGFIKDTNEMSKLKSLIDTCIKEFGYTDVKIEQDKSLPRSGASYFTANKTNVENLVYDTEGFTICYYSVKEYHIAADGSESLFQIRSYIKVR